MVDIEFQDSFRLRYVLARGFKQFGHVGAHVAGISRHAGNGILQVRRRSDILDPVFQVGLDFIEKRRISFRFFLVHTGDIQVSLLSAFKFFTLIFGQGLNHEFIHRVGHQKDFIPFFLENFQMGAVDHDADVFAGDIIDFFLVRRHVGHIIL